MRRIINYLRQCFCKHDYHIEEEYVQYINDWGSSKKGDKVYMRCKKCGYHKNHWKFL